MAFNIMDLFGPSAVNRMLQPLQNAAGIGGIQPTPGNRLLDPALMSGGAPDAMPQDAWAGMRQPTIGPAAVAVTQAMPAGVSQQQPAKKGFLPSIDKAALNDIFLGWAMGGDDWQKSLALGAANASKGKQSRGNTNQTVDWLKSRGMDEGTAQIVASDPKTLQEYLTKMVSPEQQKPLEINGKLVDPTTYQVIADFSTPKDGKDDRTSLMKELEAAGLQPGTPEYQEALIANNKPKGMVIESDGQGGFRMVQGADVSGGANLNVEQGKNTGFLIRAQDANKAITALEGEGTSLGNKAAERAPLGLGNYALSENAQQFMQAKRDFVNAVLRQESGAVISDEEFANADKQYFPQPGDGPEVIAQKRANRENALKGFRIRSGPGAQAVDGLGGATQTGVVDYREYFGGQ